jgi:hypothetical protein
VTETIVLPPVTEREAQTRNSTPLALLGVAALMELLYLALLPLSAAPGLHLAATPLLLQRPWSSLGLPGPLANSRHATTLLLLLLLLLLAGSYLLAIWQIQRAPATRRALLLGVSAALLFGVTLFFQPALFSDEAFSSLFSGRLIALYGLDPWQTAAIHLGSDPYLPWIRQLQSASVYGPLWELLVAALALVSNSPLASLLLLKGLMLASHLLNALLIWSILSKIAPEQRLSGLLLYAWNPLALMALAGSSQNEGLLLTLALLALWLHVHIAGRRGEAAALVLFALASAVNMTAVLLIPLYICFCLGREDKEGGQALRLAWRILLPLAVLIACYLPFWHGKASYQALTGAIDWSSLQRSPLAIFRPPLRLLFRLLAPVVDSPRYRRPATPVDLTIKGTALLCFLLLFISLATWLRRASATRRCADPPAPPAGAARLEPLLSAWGLLMGGWLLLMSFIFWPWYALWALWIAALRRWEPLSRALLLLSATALVSYALLNVHNQQLLDITGVLIFAPPLVYLTGAVLLRRRREFKEAQSGA